MSHCISLVLLILEIMLITLVLVYKDISLFDKIAKRTSDDHWINGAIEASIASRLKEVEEEKKLGDFEVSVFCSYNRCKTFYLLFVEILCSCKL